MSRCDSSKLDGRHRWNNTDRINYLPIVTVLYIVPLLLYPGKRPVSQCEKCNTVSSVAWTSCFVFNTSVTSLIITQQIIIDFTLRKSVVQSNHGVIYVYIRFQTTKWYINFQHYSSHEQDCESFLSEAHNLCMCPTWRPCCIRFHDLFGNLYIVGKG